MLIPLNFLKGNSVKQSFQFKVNTANVSSGSSTNIQYKLPLISTGVYNMLVDWGDGTTSTITTWNDVATTHTYPAVGIYEVEITGVCDGWRQNNTGDRSKIILVSRWGCLKITTDAAFNGCNNMYTVASDKLDIATANATNMFRACIYATFPKANKWDVSGVTNMSGMFLQAYRFNQPIGSWNVSKVTNMSSMFAGFSVSTSNDFNQDISNWNTSNVTTMSGMFQYCKFNNGGSANINNWNTGKVINMSTMFRGALLFNQPIGNWDVSKVTTMLSMFASADSFNKPLNSWNTSSVTTMSYMFAGAVSFNQPINNWNTSNVTNLSNMFYNSYYGSGKFMIFNQSLTGWNVSKVTTTAGMFKYCEVNAPINNWNLTAITDMTGMFESSFIFNNTLNNWTIGSTITNMSRLFYNCREFDQNLSSWTFIPQLPTQGVDCSFMFYWCDKFNNGGQPLTWTIRIKDASFMFSIARKFNQNIGSFLFSTNLTSLSKMFSVAELFNNGGSPDINNWQLTGTSPVIADLMFERAAVFNQPINNLFSITPLWNAQEMFKDATAFNQNIESWKFAGHSTYGFSIEGMFLNATSFNNGNSPNINNWNFSGYGGPTTFSSMFENATSFNQPIGNWILPSSLSATSRMFAGATSFNQDISTWNALYCVDTNSMFLNATAFNNGGQPMPLNDIFSYPGKDTSSMFAGCVSFNQNINGIINASGLLGSPANYMFDGCISFNNGGQPLNPLEIYGDAQYMFKGCTSFNQNVGQINFSSGLVDGLFYGCTIFNNGESPDINDSAVFDIPSMNDMFYGCTAFNQSLQNWIFYNMFSPYSATGFMGDKTPVTYPPTTYDALLNGWANNGGNLPYNLEVSFGTAKYTVAAQTSRDELVNTFGWTITDGGLA